MLRIAFGFLLLVSGLSGQLALVGETTSMFLAYLGGILATIGVLSMFAKPAPDSKQTERSLEENVSDAIAA